MLEQEQEYKRPGRTSRLGIEPLPDLGENEPKVRYITAPHRGTLPPGKKVPVWRVRFDVINHPGQHLGFDINGEVVLGRGTDTADMVDLTSFDGESLGVSRRHVMIRPTSTNLFAMDLGSKNGTLRNGQSIGVKTPYPLANGDVLNLGKLRVLVNIIDRPKMETLDSSSGFAGSIAQLAKAITSQLNVDDVLNQIAQTAMKLTSASETGIWLVDEQSGEIFLEAERGIEDEQIKLMRIPVMGDSLVNKVIQSGQPIRDSREPGKEKLKLKTHYLVEAVVFQPITLGGVTIGALMAVHRKPGQTFTPQDEQLLATIADFAAISLQNARLYESTDEALTRRVNELKALNELTEVVTSTLDLNKVHDLVVSQVRSHWDVEDVILWVSDGHGTPMRPYALDESTVERIVHGAAGQVEKVIQDVRDTGQAKTADFLSQEEMMAGGGGRKSTIKMQARSIACIPLRIQDEVAGVLSLFRKRSGMFNADDLEHLQAFANPVATALQNARLFAMAQRQRAAIQATSNALLQPLLILDDDGSILINNAPAQEIIDLHMGELFNGLSTTIGTTTEMPIGDKTYLTTSEHTPSVGTIVIMQDISYVKALERERQEFVKRLTHDLKSPITSIKGWAQLIERVTNLDEKGASFVNQIVDSSNKMVTKINGLLIAMNEDEGVKLDMQRIELGFVVKQAITELEGAALAKSLQVTFNQPDKPVYIHGDEGRLYHMALNLVSNAIKYSTDGGMVMINLAQNPDTITLTVRDTGPGIPEDELPHVFERYFRGKDAIANQPGVGLGLSVVQNMAAIHSGTVSVENNPDGGANFTVTFPRSIEAESEPVPAEG